MAGIVVIKCIVFLKKRNLGVVSEQLVLSSLQTSYLNSSEMKKKAVFLCVRNLMLYNLKLKSKNAVKV